MKKTLFVVLSLVLMMTVLFGLTGCKTDPEVTYSLDSADFGGAVKFGDELSLDGLYVVASTGERIAVTADMISGADTSSAGKKSITVTYGDQTFSVDYTVKFLVTFIIDGTVSEQLVEDVSEVAVPELPEIAGKQFEAWSRELPNVLTSNITIEAIYKDLSSEREDVYTWLGEGIIDVTGYAPSGSAYNVTVLDEDGEENGSLADVSIDTAANRITYTLKGEDPVIIIFTATNGSETVAEKSWYVQKTSMPTLTVGDGSGVIGMTVGDRPLTQKVNGTSSITFKYQITPSNNNISSSSSSNIIVIEALKAGVTEMSIKAINATNTAEYIEIPAYVVVLPGVFSIKELQNTYGIEGIWTVGRESFGGTLPALTLSYENVGAGFLDNITWVTDDSDVTVNDGVITMAAGTSKTAELVEIKARFSYGGVTLDTAPMSVRCVFDGVNVFDYNGLYQETIKSSPRPIVLQGNIKDDFSSTNYVWMNTTYDDQYYDNVGVEAKVKVLLQFKNNVYGNGYEINAHNATIGTLDSAGMPTDETIFNGPLNLVAFSQNANDGAISVKAQDNICFGVYEGVTLNNVVLKSCDLTPDPTTGKLDLTDLDYAGTTVEILGDNTVIEYCRINNGRTVLRVFGDANDAAKVIETDIKNSVLGYAREFILRMGSNCFVECEEVASDQDSPYSPLLDGDSGNDYKAMKDGRYENFTAEEREAYDSKYIKTFVNVENSVFEEAGIFAVGMDSHFAGGLLEDAVSAMEKFKGIVGFEPWKNIAKTSYGAKLTFEGDVRMYNWKNINDIDSSTLITNNIKNLVGFSGEAADWVMKLEFNVPEMLNYIHDYENESGANPFKDIIYESDGEKYVHTGIAFFGGGKNYSVFDNQVSSVSFNHALSKYEVSFEDIDQQLLTIAAGNEPFYFILYDSAGTFNYEDQQGMGKDKYSPIYAK